MDNRPIMDILLEEYDKLDFSQYTERDVEYVLAKDHLNLDDYKVLLSKPAKKYLEPMAQRAKKLTLEHFGKNIGLYTPIYIANYCVNGCSYCGFNKSNHIHRAKLSLEEIDQEARNIAKTKLKDILLLTGESRQQSSVEYIGEAVKILKKYFNSVGIEVYPLETEEYRYLHGLGVDFLSVYQETYDTKRYDEVHLSGPKKVYSYRFNAPERGLMGGLRGVSIGALLGLSDFRKDAFATGMHGYLLQRRYPAAEVCFSVPRLRPCAGGEHTQFEQVYDADLLQIMLALRIFMPFSGINLSTRESASFRDNVLGLAPTKISAGVHTGIGGHGSEQKGDEQFEINDTRSVEEYKQFLTSRGYQYVFNDYIYV